ncbi:pyridoxamine 5'-phosphate oxidase family protein [Butyrivibrio sp.]|uniref:pyridoxamine 5'-phosphate oxidase family protein n=1 Tax=Butyrivibrio sp. TaxID=28121 RepID=UPI0025C0169C|nr:pyridoxamine 5'-phosphate oxidase family protein [Butyrivibrio sp.]
MSKHIEVNGKLVQANKRYSDLKQRQKSQISQWLYDAYKKQVAENITDDEALEPVFEKIDEAQIWIPEKEIRAQYRGKKIKFKKRMEATVQRDSFKFDYNKAANYWLQKDANSNKMDRAQVMERIVSFIEGHNTCTLATASEGHTRCTPIEYNFVDKCFYFFSEGGLNFRGLKKNKNVGIAIYEPYNGFANLKSLQIEGTASLIEPFSEEYLKIMAFKKIPEEAMRKLPQPMALIKVVPTMFDYLDSDLKKEDYSSRQHYVV